MKSRRTRPFRAGFAFLKPLITAGAALAVVVPRFVHHDPATTGVTISSDQQAKETALKSGLSLLRNAEYKFFSDTNYWPLSTPNTALDGAGNKQTIPDWFGRSLLQPVVSRFMFGEAS